MSDDSREFYTDMFYYAPFMIEGMARLAGCFKSYWEAQVKGFEIYLIFKDVAPTYKGVVIVFDKVDKNKQHPFTDLSDLQVILDLYAEEGQYEKN